MATRQMDDIHNMYPSNSHAAKDQASYAVAKEVTVETTKVVTEQKPVKKVTNAKVRKQGLLRKLGKSLIEDGIETAKEKAYNEIIVPGLKTLIFDTATDVLDSILFGGEGGGRDYRGRNRRREDRTSYSDYYNRKNKGEDRGRRNDPRYEPDDIIVDTRTEAKMVLDELDDHIRQYGQASVADFYDIVGVTSDWTDNRYGWTNLRDASIRPVRDGFLIILPRTHVLEN